MTEQQYAAKLINVKKRYERKYYGSVFLALRKQKAPIKAALLQYAQYPQLLYIENNVVPPYLQEIVAQISAKPVEDALRKLYKEIGPYEAEREYRRLKRFEKGLGEPSFDWLSDIMEFFDRYILDQVSTVMLDVTKKRIIYKLQEGISTGQSIDDMVKALADTELDKVRARLIVRTECNRAMNAGHNLSVTHIGFEVKKVWISARDSRTRGRDPEDESDHFRMHNQTVKYDEPFIDPKTEAMLMFPGDTSLGAGASDVINCRCVSIYKPAVQL